LRKISANQEKLCKIAYSAAIAIHQKYSVP